MYFWKCVHREHTRVCAIQIITVFQLGRDETPWDVEGQYTITHKQRQTTEMRKAKGLDMEKPKACDWI